MSMAELQVGRRRRGGNWSSVAIQMFEMERVVRPGSLWIVRPKKSKTLGRKRELEPVGTARNGSARADVAGASSSW